MTRFTRGLGLILTLTLAMLLGTVASPASAAPRNDVYAVPVTDVTGAVAGGGTFVGDFVITDIVRDGGELLAVGTLTGELTGTLNDGLVNETVEIPINLDQTSGSCEILNLVRGPLDLNLLGLEVFLDTVTLDITAVPDARRAEVPVECGAACDRDLRRRHHLPQLVRRRHGLPLSKRRLWWSASSRAGCEVRRHEPGLACRRLLRLQRRERSQGGDATVWQRSPQVESREWRGPASGSIGPLSVATASPDAVWDSWGLFDAILGGADNPADLPYPAWGHGVSGCCRCHGHREVED